MTLVEYPGNIHERIYMLQYFHSKLNEMLFDGKLNSAVIVPHIWLDEENYPTRDITATTVTEYSIPIIAFNVFDLEEDDDMFLITVLLHEMIHQCCSENEIEDIDEEGNHNKCFEEMASHHGLINNGYCLSHEIEEIIRFVLILSYKPIYNSFWKTKDFEKHYKKIKEDIEQAW